MIRSCPTRPSATLMSPATRPSRWSSPRMVGIAPSSNAQKGATTDTGPSARSCGLRQRSNQRACKLWPLPGFFVLEVDVDVTALRGPLLDHFRPLFYIHRAIPLVPQPEVPVVGRHFDRGWQLLAVGDAQRQVPR